VLKHKYLILLTIWLIIITALGLVELDVSNVPKVKGLDKLVHITFHFFLTILLLLHQIYERKKWKGKQLLINCFIFSLSYGIIIEILQNLITQKRSADLLDVLANMTGSIVSILIFRYIYRLKNNTLFL
jgi:VanZ family protein